MIDRDGHTPFDQLTTDQQIARLREVSRRAAAEWKVRKSLGASAASEARLRAIAARYGLSYGWLMGRCPCRRMGRSRKSVR